MVDNYLLLDMGTGPDRYVSVYCLTDSARPVYSGNASRISVIRPDSVMFYEIVRDRRPTEKNCPEAARWRAEGATPVFLERVVVSLKTTVKRRTGEIVCEALQ